MTILQFGAQTTHLAPGRTRLSFDEAERELVLDAKFSQSVTRAQLWLNLEKYLVKFGQLEQKHSGDLNGPLIHFLWIGGSFASSKLDPKNIDVTVCVDGPGRAALRGKKGAGWMNEAFKRRKIEPTLGIAPLEMKYWPVASVFQFDKLEENEQHYLRSRGGWDDWWQRRRLQSVGASKAPTVQSAHPARGYLEVTL